MTSADRVAWWRPFQPHVTSFCEDLILYLSHVSPVSLSTTVGTFILNCAVNLTRLKCARGARCLLCSVACSAFPGFLRLATSELNFVRAFRLY